MEHATAGVQEVQRPSHLARGGGSPGSMAMVACGRTDLPTPALNPKSTLGLPPPTCSATLAASNRLAGCCTSLPRNAASTLPSCISSITMCT